MAHPADPAHHLLRRLLHAAPDPVQHDPDKGVLVEIRDVRLVFLGDGIAAGELLHHVDQQAVDHAAQIGFDLLPLNGVIDPLDEGPVLDDGVAQGGKALLPGPVVLPALEGAAALLLADPVDQVVDVLEVVVEGHAIHAAVRRDVGNRDLGERFLGEQRLERLGQGPLGELRHGHPSFRQVQYSTARR